MATPSKVGKDVEKRERIVKRIARELRDGFYVNLGIGMPTLVANHVPRGIDVILQSEATNSNGAILASFWHLRGMPPDSGTPTDWLAAP